MVSPVFLRYPRILQTPLTPLAGTIPLFDSYRPYLTEVFPGGNEVEGWLVSPWWRNLGAWARLLLDRNLHGLIAFDNNPEPWPGFYWGILEAERSHLEVSWPLVCDDSPSIFGIIPPRDWRRMVILKNGHNPCK